MKRRGYKFGCQWIADNDNPGDPDALNVETVSGFISVLLLADMFGKEPEEVALKVVALRLGADGKAKGLASHQQQKCENCNGEPYYDLQGDRACCPCCDGKGVQ